MVQRSYTNGILHWDITFSQACLNENNYRLRTQKSQGGKREEREKQCQNLEGILTFKSSSS